MKKLLCFLVLIFFGCAPKFNPTVEKNAILEVLKAQETAWNSGNVDGFMEGYWKSDSLMFIGMPITYGWNSTLQRYKKSYPTQEIMGQLDFTFYGFKFIDNENCLVTGKYHLKRASDEPTGMFTLLLKRIEGKWVVVYDHTS